MASAALASLRRSATPAAAEASPATATGPTVLGLMVSVLFLLNAYTLAHLHSADRMLFPTPLCGVAAVYFFIAHARELSLAAIAKLFTIVAIATISTLFAGSATDGIGPVLFGFANLAYSLIVTYLFYLEFRTWSRTAMRRFFTMAMLVLLVGAVLEVAGPLRGLSDRFRETFFFEDFLYSYADRDIGLFGFERPRLFTLEPSYLGLWISFLATLGVLVSDRERDNIIYFGLLCAAFFVVASPTLLVGVAISGVIWLLKPAIEAGSITAPRRNIAMTLLLLACAGLVATVGVATVFAERIAEMMQGKDGSLNSRLLGSFFITFEILKVDPLFGMGLGGKRDMTDAFIRGLSHIMANPYSYVESGRLLGLITNAPLHQFAMFGLFGGSIIFGISLWLYRQLAERGFIIFLAIFASFGMMMGGFNGVRWWSYTMMTCAVLNSFGRQIQEASAVARLTTSPDPHALRALRPQPIAARWQRPSQPAGAHV